MCHFILIGTPSTIDEGLIDTLAKSQSLRLRPSWLTVSGHGMPSEVFYSTARHCDCGTAIGSRNRDSAPEDRLAGKLKAWRRKKWSEAKIARAAAAMMDAHKYEQSDGGDTRQWFDFLNALMRHSGFTHVSLVLHWCGNEREFNVTGKTKIRLTQISHEALIEWNEDVLYVCTF